MAIQAHAQNKGVNSGLETLDEFKIAANLEAVLIVTISR